MAKIYLENGITPPAIIVQDDATGAPAGFTLTEDIVDFDLYASRIVSPIDQREINFIQLKQKIEDRIAVQGGYGALDTDEQEVAAKWYLTTEAQRDSHITDVEQQGHAHI